MFNEDGTTFIEYVVVAAVAVVLILGAMLRWNTESMRAPWREAKFRRLERESFFGY